MQLGVDVTCMYTDFGGRSYFGFGDTTTFKNGQFSLFDHGLYSPWSSKNLIDQDRLKKFMQVGLDETCMYTDFGGHGPSSFGGFAPFRLPSKTAKTSLRTMDYSPWSSKNLIDWNRLKKFMRVGLDVTCMYANFGGHGPSSFGGIAPFRLPSKTAKTSLWTMDYSPWSSKNLIDRNQLKKFMQLGADVTCMYIDFGGRSYFGFGDTATFKNGQFSLFDHGL